MADPSVNPATSQPELERARPAAGADAAHAAQVARLFSEHNRTLIAFLSSRLDSVAEAQEVAQEAYVRLLRLEHPEQVGFLRAYLFRIASNLAVDRLRQRNARADTDQDEPLADLFEEWLAAPAPERRALAADQLRIVREALRELPRKTSAAFVMHAIEGCGFDVIAQTMQLSERMVRYHVARAMAHCRERLDAEENT
ncbi:RNA polymerase sigma factor [Dokdonella sp.]|uniref:RNA polymerase sigma factor n=1 Tax=Dokdonella sp. TaxID=2291710 RepID=UPI001B2EF689|nr:RNA polymerase sigma factor [Dokdonella sp.]MBO9664772.1 RNA polymerase sigma factor [Dokdonella sp.]